MDYRRIYSSIISTARGRSTIGGYTEFHHIIPRCLGGSDDADNLVELTFPEHLVCHHLLHKMYPDDRRLSKAWGMMSHRRLANKDRSWLRSREHSKLALYGSTHTYSHPTHGSIECAPSQLAHRYSLNVGDVCGLSSGRSKSVKGWVLGTDVSNSRAMGEKFLFSHPDKGTVYVSKSDMKRISGTGSTTDITRLVRGELSHIKGWVLGDKPTTITLRGSIITLQHTDGTVVSGTRLELIDATQLSQSTLTSIIKHHKSRKGWSIIGPQ